MKRITVNLGIDLLAAAFFVGMIATGYILYFALPPGTHKSLSLWNLTRHAWGQIHAWISLGLLLTLLAHLALHWKWVVAAVAQRLGLAKARQDGSTRTGLLTLLAVTAALALFAWITQISVRDRKDPPYASGPTSGDASITTPKQAPAPRTAAHSPINFWKQVYPVLASSCLRCHGPRQAHGGFRIDRREDYFGRNGQAALVIAGKSAQSPLIAIVQGRKTDMAMAASHKLPDRDVDILRTWIDAGAEWPEQIRPGP